MKNLTIFAIPYALLSAVCAQDEDRERPLRHALRATAFLERYDQNEDRKISKEEFSASERTGRLSPEARGKIFKRLDKDADGFISLKELKKLAPNGGRRHPLAKADRDQDGRISKDEFSAHPPFAKMPMKKREEVFARLDQNADGFLDQDEGRFRGGKKRRREGRIPSRRKIKEADLDGNGSLSWEEFSKASSLHDRAEEAEEAAQEGELEARKKAMFQEMDRNKNSELSVAEIRAHAAHRASGRRENPKK